MELESLLRVVGLVTFRKTRSESLDVSNTHSFKLITFSTEQSNVPFDFL